MAHYVKKNGVITPLNGRSAQDYLEAKGRIVVDISNQQVGDVIRVRSLLDPNQVWNKEITAAGDYMVFDVPCKDIYAICLVQDVDGVSTEIIKVERPIDYGQILLVKLFDKTSLAGIQGILDAHAEMNMLRVGDEIIITYDGSPWPVLIGDIDLYGDHDVIFVSKYLIPNALAYGVFNPLDSFLNTGCYSLAHGFSQSIEPSDKQYIKPMQRESSFYSSSWQASIYESYTWSPMAREIDEAMQQERVHTTIIPKVISIFGTTVGRAKTTPDGTSRAWTLADIGHVSGSANYESVINGDGTTSWYTTNGSQVFGVLPCFRMTADI